MTVRCLFVDRDGTINIDKGHVYRREDFEYIPGALDALKRVSDGGVPIFIVTNQAGIAKGLYTEQDFTHLTRFMLDDMREHGIVISDVLFCPHHPDGVVPAYRRQCDCRKPGTSLLRRVIDEGHVQPGDSAIVGDKNSDIEAGRKVGVRTYLVETGYGKLESRSTSADFIVKDLQAAVDHFLKDTAAK